MLTFGFGFAERLTSVTHRHTAPTAVPVAEARAPVPEQAATRYTLTTKR